MPWKKTRQNEKGEWRCWKCTKHKPISEFHLVRYIVTKVPTPQSMCKSCHPANSKQRYYNAKGMNRESDD